jgi:DNA-binding MarR family transcriptional regulator
MTQLPEELPDELAMLWYLVRRVAGLMDLAQFLVLSVVDAHPGNLSQQAIADRLGLTKGTVSRQIDNASAAGLMSVQTAAHTRRENAVALTEAGTTLVRRGDELFEQSRADMLESVSRRDLATTVRALKALLATLTD